MVLDALLTSMPDLLEQRGHFLALVLSSSATL